MKNFNLSSFSCIGSSSSSVLSQVKHLLQVLTSLKAEINVHQSECLTKAFEEVLGDSMVVWEASFSKQLPECNATLQYLLYSMQKAQSLLKNSCSGTQSWTTRDWLDKAFFSQDNTHEFDEALLDLERAVFRVNCAVKALLMETDVELLQVMQQLETGMAEALKPVGLNLAEAAKKDCSELQSKVQQIMEKGLQQSKEEKSELKTAELLFKLLRLSSFSSYTSYVENQKVSGVEHSELPAYLKIDKPDQLKHKGILGQGSYGAVFKCKWMGTTVAVKCFPAGDTSFEREVSALASLRNRNIVRILGYTLSPHSMVMELMDMDLHDLLQKDKALTLGVSLEIMLQIARGMVFLHQKHIFHRDLKTRNVLVIRNGEYFIVKLADFGLAKTKFNSSKAATMTNKAGTPHFMAPEVFDEDEKRYTKKADVYSFAMVCYEILSRLEPFSVQLEQGIFGQRFYELVKTGLRPELPASTPRFLSSLLERCWHADPNMRPPFEDICELLTNVQDLSLIPNFFRSLSKAGLKVLARIVEPEKVLEQAKLEGIAGIDNVKKLLLSLRQENEQGLVSFALVLGDYYFKEACKFTDAYSCYEMAAEFESAEGEWRLGMLTELGKGAIQNHERAHDFYNKAASKGYMNAVVELGRLEQSAEHFKRALEYQNSANVPLSCITELIDIMESSRDYDQCAWTSLKLWELTFSPIGRLLLGHFHTIKRLVAVLADKDVVWVAKKYIENMIQNMSIERELVHFIIWNGGVAAMIDHLRNELEIRREHPGVDDPVGAALAALNYVLREETAAYKAIEGGIMPIIESNKLHLPALETSNAWKCWLLDRKI